MTFVSFEAIGKVTKVVLLCKLKYHNHSDAIMLNM